MILQRLGVPPQRLLVVTDFDGTLAPIVSFPAHARPLPGAMENLSLLAEEIGQVVLLTGRTRLSLLLALGDAAPSGVRILCNYGADDPANPPNAEETERDGAAIGHLLEEIARLHGQLPEGVMIEEKGRSVALHTRGCREPAAALSQIAILLGPIAHQTGLDLQQGRDVIDIGIRFGGKAEAVRRLLREAEWSGAVMFGDDHSDLDAFDVLAEAPLPTFTVGVQSAEVPGIAARSDHVVDSPKAVVALISQLRAEVSGEPRADHRVAPNVAQSG